MASISCVFWKAALAIPLLALLFLVVKCPCKKVLCCHLRETWLLIALFIGLVVLINGFKLFDGSCSPGVPGSGH
jgi:hypothetical protein